VTRPAALDRREPQTRGVLRSVSPDPLFRTWMGLKRLDSCEPAGQAVSDSQQYSECARYSLLEVGSARVHRTQGLSDVREPDR
jgi:hypothetical protein